MSILEEVKKLLDKELKKFNKKIKTISDKYEDISYEHELLLSDIEALDNRLIFVEKKLKISNDDDNDKYCNKSTNNIKELGDFRYQIITRSKARQLMNNQHLNQNPEKEELNINNINSVFGEKRQKENNLKNSIRKKKETKEKSKNRRNFSNGSDIDNSHDNELDNSDEINNNEINKNKLENTYNKANSLLNQDNSSNINNESTDLMSFKNKNININDKKSIISTSENFSEFSFNPQKWKNKNNNNQNNNLQQQTKINSVQKPIKDLKDILNSQIIKNIQELELIIKSLPNYNKFDDIPTIQTIFQSSFNGDSAKNFHKFCDGEPNVIVVVETDKGNRFGGFSTIGFNSDGEYKKDYYSFLFSFDNMKVYKNKNKTGRKAIYCNEEYGPYFGDKENKDLQISDNWFTNYSYVGKIKGCFFNMDIDYELNKGNSNFIVNKLEIFKILI